eukprot:2741651-Alexandrium_andersonii.AAC.1
MSRRIGRARAGTPSSPGVAVPAVGPRLADALAPWERPVAGPPLAVGDLHGVARPFVVGPGVTRFSLHPFVADLLDRMSPSDAALEVCRFSDVLLFEYNYWMVDAATEVLE